MVEEEPYTDLETLHQQLEEMPQHVPGLYKLLGIITCRKDFFLRNMTHGSGALFYVCYFVI